MDDSNVTSTSIASTSLQPSYSRSAYASSFKGRGGKERGKGASTYKLKSVPPRGTFAGIAPGGRVNMPRGRAALGILEQVLVNMSVLVWTWEGGPPTDRLSHCR